MTQSAETNSVDKTRLSRICAHFRHVDWRMHNKLQQALLHSFSLLAIFDNNFVWVGICVLFGLPQKKKLRSEHRGRRSNSASMTSLTNSKSVPRAIFCLLEPSWSLSSTCIDVACVVGFSLELELEMLLELLLELLVLCGMVVTVSSGACFATLSANVTFFLCRFWHRISFSSWGFRWCSFDNALLRNLHSLTEVIVNCHSTPHCGLPVSRVGTRYTYPFSRTTPIPRIAWCKIFWATALHLSVVELVLQERQL